MTPCTQTVWGTQGAPRQSPISRLPCRPRQGQDCHEFWDKNMGLKIIRSPIFKLNSFQGSSCESSESLIQVGSHVFHQTDPTEEPSLWLRGRNLPLWAVQLLQVSVRRRFLTLAVTVPLRGPNKYQKNGACWSSCVKGIQPNPQKSDPKWWMMNQLLFKLVINHLALLL